MLSIYMYTDMYSVCIIQYIGIVYKFIIAQFCYVLRKMETKTGEKCEKNKNEKKIKEMKNCFVVGFVIFGFLLFLLELHVGNIGLCMQVCIT